MRELRVEIGQSTDVGRKRTVNEDNLGLLVPADGEQRRRIGSLFIVADGMGGHAKGEVASALAITTITRAYLHSDSPSLEERIATALREANAVIWDEAGRQLEAAGMGTTIVCGVVVGDELIVANAGDSRAYLIRHRQPRQLTRDHSWVGEMVAAGRITPAEARRHKMRNVITRCLGGRADLEVTSYPREQLIPGDALVLCTDGLWGTTADQEIALLVSQFSPQVAADRLVALANERGGPDNITVLVARVWGDEDDTKTLSLQPFDDDATLTDSDETLRGVGHDLRQLPHG
jgi:protein phosphatase